MKTFNFSKLIFETNSSSRDALHEDILIWKSNRDCCFIGLYKFLVLNWTKFPFTNFVEKILPQNVSIFLAVVYGSFWIISLTQIGFVLSSAMYNLPSSEFITKPIQFFFFFRWANWFFFIYDKTWAFKCFVY